VKQAGSLDGGEFKAAMVFVIALEESLDRSQLIRIGRWQGKR